MKMKETSKKKSFTLMSFSTFFVMFEFKCLNVKEENHESGKWKQISYFYKRNKRRKLCYF